MCGFCTISISQDSLFLEISSFPNVTMITKIGFILIA